MAYNHENLIIGCGNILYGDDGFGPAVIEYMKEHNIILEGDTQLIDGATSAPHYIFTLPENKWKNIIIIDIASMNKKPGEIDVLKLNQIKEQERYLDVHGISATDPLHELEDHINIRIVACEPENVPDEMELGISETLEKSIPQVIEKVKEVLSDLLNS
ncbi:MAG: coenzyme F420-reducing hydrogenase, FrhD protein [Methanosphaera stadtmanae]|nr:coenzyme F420-reducing hydrogenase, FrhD protein [Methanosphaera stadtmanae]